MPTAQEIAQQRGVGLRRAQQILKAERQAEALPTGHKDRIIAALRAAKRPLDLTEVSDQTGIDAHNCAHVVWALQKQGLVRFRDGHERGLLKIRLQEAVMDGVKLPDRRRDGVGTLPVSDRDLPSITTHRPHKVGLDLTDPRNQPAITPGGPVTRIPGPPNQNEKPDVPAFVMDGIPEPVAFAFVISDEDYPGILQLRRRADQIHQAAELLEASGNTELALAALDSLKYTNLEEEVMKLLKALGM